MVGDPLILRETAMLADCDLCVLQRKDANGIRQVGVKLVLPFEPDLNVLTDVEVLVVFQMPHSRPFTFGVVEVAANASGARAR
jgi:hypothetical protein